MPTPNRVRWTRDQLLVILNLYHKLRFGQFDQRQAVIIDLAKRIGRTPSAVAMKLSNFASLDPALQLRGIKGLETERLNVRNGICLNRLHDAAFDQGLIAVDDELRLLLSARLKSLLPHQAVQNQFEAHEGKPLEFSDDAIPCGKTSFKFRDLLTGAPKKIRSLHGHARSSPTSNPVFQDRGRQ
jgi:hypothetical protein